MPTTHRPADTYRAQRRNDCRENYKEVKIQARAEKLDKPNWIETWGIMLQHSDNGGVKPDAPRYQPHVVKGKVYLNKGVQEAARRQARAMG